MALKPRGKNAKPGQLRPRQIEILKALARRNKDGSNLDIYQLIKAISPGLSREAMYSALRYLAAHGLVEDGPMERRATKQGVREVRTFQLTAFGLNVVRPQNLPQSP